MQPNGDNLTAIAISVGGHILIVLLLLFGLRSSGGAQPVAANIIEGALLVTTAVPDTAVPLPVPAEPVDDSAVRLAEEQRAEEERAAAEQRAEEERAAAEQRAEEERRREADRLREQEAAEQRAEQERLAEEARAAEERRQAEEARLEEERRQAEAARVAEEKRKADAERLARERRAEEERERKAAADRARAAQEARRQAEEEAALQAMLADEEARNQGGRLWFAGRLHCEDQTENRAQLVAAAGFGSRQLCVTRSPAPHRRSCERRACRLRR